ncbi:MAG: hypothetical protein Q6361_05845, partial [Candidatus Hermodarchaeota archaeon]|nr:hypothetical protein [Candidatus Hermodarchaeota archaeon]
MQHKSTYRRVLSLGLIFVLTYLILPSQNALNCQVSPTPAPVIIFGEDMDIGYDLIEPEPGQYILTGQTHSFGNGRSDIWLMEVDDEGVVHWNITFGGIADETGRAIINCQNGDYAVVGYTSSFGAGSYDLWLLRISPTGQLLWNRTYGTPGFDYGAALIEIEEHLYICGYTDNGYVGNN